MITSKVKLNHKKCVLAIETLGHAYLEASRRTAARETQISEPKYPFHTAHNDPPHNDRIIIERSVCTAVSTVEQQFFYAIKMLTDLNPTLDMQHKLGSFKLEIPCSDQILTKISSETLHNWKILSETFSIGYKMILSNHSDLFHVTWITLDHNRSC
ncbi:hypothetical protein COTS27_00610 [Spirochaetota bacterium]|nr:hypothetical protein COTS27_00610 [Spirochaetota bacterium]